MQAPTNHARTNNAHSRLYCAYDENGQAHQIDDDVNDLNLLIDFMNQIIHGTELPYCIIDGNPERVVKRKLATFVPFMPAMLRLYDADLAYSPDLALFFDTCCNHPIRGRLHNDDLNGVAGAGLVNDFVITMRKAAKQQKIRRKMRDWRRNATENRKRLGVYTDHLFKRHARLCVIRIDLHYRQVQCESGIDLKDAESKLKADRHDERNAFLFRLQEVPAAVRRPSRVSLEDAKFDWKHFADNMRGKPRLFKNLAGYVASFEYSKYGGYHIHAALFFDGSLVRQDSWLADQIGEYWVQVTAGRGYFYNCNRHKEKYGRSVGVGAVDYHDVEKRDALLNALGYLAKQDQFVRVKISRKAKTFLTGKISSDWNRGVGRPRSKLIESDRPDSQMLTATA